MVQLLDKMVGMGYNIPEDVPVSGVWNGTETNHSHHQC